MNPDITDLTSKELSNRIREAARNVQPGSELDRVLRRWEGHRWTIRRNGVWDMGGIITYFRHCLDVMHAVDPSVDPRLPSQCYDPECIAQFFRIPLEELVRPDDGCVRGTPGRKPVMHDVADFAAVRWEKRMPWKDILRKWREEHPDDERDMTLSKMQEAFYRKYRGRGKTHREPPL